MSSLRGEDEPQRRHEWRGAGENREQRHAQPKRHEGFNKTNGLRRSNATVRGREIQSKYIYISIYIVKKDPSQN